MERRVERPGIGTGMGFEITGEVVGAVEALEGEGGGTRREVDGTEVDVAGGKGLRKGVDSKATSKQRDWRTKRRKERV